jgi:hypothetical protein
VIRSFETVRPSGITFDGEAIWIGSTFSDENVRCDAMTGAVLDRRPTPGCTTYHVAGDPPPPRRRPRPRPRGSRRRRTCGSRARTARNGAMAGCGRRRRRHARFARSTPPRGPCIASSPPAAHARTAWRGKDAISGSTTAISMRYRQITRSTDHLINR